MILKDSTQIIKSSLLSPTDQIVTEGAYALPDSSTVKISNK